MRWRAFVHEGKEYDLSHLWPRGLVFSKPAQNDKPVRSYPVDIHFGLHCFTRGIKTGERPHRSLLYSDARETRVFDFVRYELSLLLPAIVEELPVRKCHHTGKGNFFSVEVVDRAGIRRDYYIFFELARAARGLRLLVQSAYLRDQPLRSKPIGFFVLLFNIQNNKPIKSPP